MTFYTLVHYIRVDKFLYWVLGEKKNVCRNKMDSKLRANIGNRKNFFEFTQKPIKIIMGKPLKSPKFKLSRIVRPILVKTLLFPLRLHVLMYCPSVPLLFFQGVIDKPRISGYFPPSLWSLLLNNAFIIKSSFNR